MTNDPASIAAKLTKAQRGALCDVQDDDCACLSRGDPSGLTASGLAIPPLGQGFYQLNPLGLAVQAILKEQNNDQR